MKLPSTPLTRWQWTVCILLLLATMINYMDRQVLANMSVRITEELKLTEQQYGNVAWAFGTAFAFGSLAFGFIVDRVSVRILYPVVLLAWSAVGFLTGFVWDYWSLLGCRLLLGFFEAGHWPCALVVTQAVLAKQDRAFGNSILQSGASIGAIITPLIIASLLATSPEANAWRIPFQVVGCVGLLWAVLWLVAIPRGALNWQMMRPVGVRSSAWFYTLIQSRKFWALVVMIIGINTAWQSIREWMPKFLEKGREYSHEATLYFTSAYFIATDIGCIAAGAAVSWLSRRGRTVHSARLVIYALAAALTALTCVAAFLPQSWILLGVMLIIGAGALGVFPSYYSFTQELSSTNLGKATGVLAFLGWIASSPIHNLFGRYVDRTGSFDLGIALVGLAPLAGLLAMLILWPKDDSPSKPA